MHFFPVFIENVSVSFERLYFRFHIISVSKITIVSISVDVGSIIFVSVIGSITEISLVVTYLLTTTSTDLNTHKHTRLKQTH